MEKLMRGTQVIYTPTHLQGKEGIETAYPGGKQPGFVTSGPTPMGKYFVRYWRIENGKALPELRTLANSESTDFWDLTIVDTFPQETVDIALEEWC